jgi:hypothetical protein
MKTLSCMAGLLALPLKRARALRGDERGNVLIVSGMMAFLAAIFAVLSVDTSEAIYNRIIALNAVDSAADAAALWQARGCNLLQQLNNIHYEGNEFFATAENVSLSSCVLAAIADLIPGGQAVSQMLCPICRMAKPINDMQGVFSTVVLDTQKGVTVFIPFAALLAANDAAQGSGADNVLTSAADYVSQFLAKFGIPIPSGFLSSIGGTLSDAGFTVYALPLDPSSLGLGASETEGDSYPWQYPSGIYQGLFDAGVGAGVLACGLDPPDGWQDSYYEGHPGFMTWIAGKSQHDEMLGLGDLAWLNGGNNAPNVHHKFMNQDSPALYRGSVHRSDTPLVIPAFIAIASSQVQGDTVVSRGTPNAYGTLMPVYVPFVNEAAADLTPFPPLTIYH